MAGSASPYEDGARQSYVVSGDSTLMSSACSSQMLTIPVICVQEIRRSLLTSTSSSPLPSSGSTRNSATTTPAQSIRVDLRATLSADSVVSVSTETTSYTHIVETSMNAAISVTAGKAVDNSNTMSTTMRLSSTSARIISCVQTENAWRRSLLYSTQKWISRPTRSRRIRMA